MANLEFTMQSILDIPLWEEMQDKLAKLTGTAILCVDMNGNPVTKHSGPSDFCRVIRANLISRKRCLCSEASSRMEAIRRGGPFIYRCHCGLVNVVVPIMVEDKFLGAMMSGQVRLKNDDSEKAIQLIDEISSLMADKEAAQKQLLEMYERLPEMEFTTIDEIADLVEAIVKHAVAAAVRKCYREESYQLPLSAEPENPLTESPVKPDSPIYPALVFILEHPGDKVSLKKMAELCNLSPSYFSRVFSRDMGETFIHYTNRQKMELAKKLLSETNQSVLQIAGELGYLDTGHFINVFKRFAGITPMAYRQHKWSSATRTKEDGLAVSFSPSLE